MARSNRFLFSSSPSSSNTCVTQNPAGERTHAGSAADVPADRRHSARVAAERPAGYTGRIFRDRCRICRGPCGRADPVKSIRTHGLSCEAM